MTSPVSLRPTHRGIRIFVGLVLLGLRLAASPPARTDTRLLVDARINDHAVRFAFDTGFGADIVVFTPTLRRLGIKVTSPPAQNPPPGLVNTGATEPVKLELLNQVFPSTRLQVFDAPGYLDFGADGLVGWPALHQNVIKIDVANMRWTILPGLPAEVTAWRQIPIRSEASVLTLAAPPDSLHPGSEILVDTGTTDAVSLARDRWSAWRTAHPQAPTTLNAYFMPGAGLVVAEQCWADEIEIGGLVLRNVVVQPANITDRVLAGAGQEYAATLGLAALAQFDLVLDGIHGQAYFKPRHRKPARFWNDYNRLGAVFVPATPDGNDLIAHVASNSPAARAGIRDGDQLLKVDRIDVTAWRSNPAVRPGVQFWNQPAGTRFTLTLRRGTQLLSTPVTLRDILAPAR